MVNKSTHTALDAATVTTMPEVRVSIDDLDRQIVTLLGMLFSLWRARELSKTANAFRGAYALH